MSDTLFIEWDRDQLIAATGSAGGSAVTLRSAVVVDRDNGNLLPSELGANLSAALSGTGLTAEQAVVVFPRELVTFHRIELPNLGDDEIPDMVRLQAATRLTVPVESVCLDFAPLPVRPGSESREVLLVTAPQKHVTEVRECLAAAEIELKGIRVSSFGIAASVVHSGLLPKGADEHAVEAVVSLRSDSIEMIFMTGHNVAFSHSGASWTSLDGVEQAVRSEISRARMAAAEDMGSYTVRRLTLIGSPEITSAIPDSVAGRLNDAEVVRVDPEGTILTCSLPQGITSSDMLPLAGAVANQQTSAIEAVDLISPRKAPERRDYSRIQKIVLVGAVALALVGGWNWRSGKIRDLESEAADLEFEASEMKKTYDSKMAKNQRLMAKRLTDWSDRDISWLDEMNAVRQLMQNTERVYIKRFKFTAGTGGRHAGKIEADGFAKARIDIENLQRVLTDAGYEVTPQPITQSPRDPQYAMELKLEISIPVRKPQPAAKANAKT